MAGNRLSRATAVSGHWLDREDAGPLNAVADPQADRSGNAPASVCLGAGLAGRPRVVEGKRIGIDATTLEANAAMRSIVRRDSGESYNEFLTGLANPAAPGKHWSPPQLCANSGNPSHSTLLDTQHADRTHHPGLNRPISEPGL